MNRRSFEILFGIASGAVGLAVALYTAVIATPDVRQTPETTERPTENAASADRNA